MLLENKCLHVYSALHLNSLSYPDCILFFHPFIHTINDRQFKTYLSEGFDE